MHTGTNTLIFSLSRTHNCTHMHIHTHTHAYIYAHLHKYKHTLTLTILTQSCFTTWSSCNCIKDRLPDRHLHLNLYHCVKKFPHSVPLSLTQTELIYLDLQRVPCTHPEVAAVPVEILPSSSVCCVDLPTARRHMHPWPCPPLPLSVCVGHWSVTLQNVYSDVKPELPNCPRHLIVTCTLKSACPKTHCTTAVPLYLALYKMYLLLLHISLTHIQRHIPACTHLHIHAYYAHKPINALSHIHMQTSACTNVCMNTHKHTHTQTHTQTHLSLIHI